ncbi:MAG: hypothetical protein NTZ56_20615 [Acidobacteria bacterium]|nr:hypothetical protein [Acidobacteriota bacterium]
MRFTWVLAIAATMVFPLGAGKFNHGLLGTSSDVVRLRVPRPPDAYPQIKSVNVQIVEADKGFTDQARLRMTIEQKLNKDFKIESQKGDATLKISVVTYDVPTVRREMRKETKSVEVSKKEWKTVEVSVPYWVGKGSISLSVRLLDAEGDTLDTFDPTSSYSQSRPLESDATGTTGSGLMSRALHAVNTPKQRGPSAPVDTAADINAALLSDLGHQILRRYVNTVDDLEIKLGCDDELRAGNKLVLGTQPDWEGAIKLWEAVKMKKNEGDRIYNLAVAYEALAYKEYAATLNPVSASEYFAKALDTYDRAMKADPTEKYIQGAAERLRLAKTNLDRAKDQRANWETEREKRRQEYHARLEGQRAIDSRREDSDQEKSFRRMVRRNLRSPNPGDLAKMGQDVFKLNELETTRILKQENARLVSVSEYETQFKMVVDDKVVSKEEREDLTLFAQGKNLDADDLRAVEAKYTFAEPGAPKAVPVAAPATVSTAPRATSPTVPKPAAPKAGTPATAAPGAGPKAAAVSVAPAKPATAAKK